MKKSVDMCLDVGIMNYVFDACDNKMRQARQKKISSLK